MNTKHKIGKIQQKLISNTFQKYLRVQRIYERQISFIFNSAILKDIQGVSRRKVSLQNIIKQDKQHEQKKFNLFEYAFIYFIIIYII